MVMPYLFDSQASSNAFRDAQSSHVSIFKGPDGKFYKQTIINDNGNEIIKNEKVDREEAERQIKERQAKTEHRINESFNKVQQDIKKTQKTIADQIKNSFKSFNFF